MASIGEIFGTGVIGALIAYPVANPIKGSRAMGLCGAI